MAAAGRGVEKALKKLSKSIEDGEFYEAHQMYRTLYFRYKNQKKFNEAVELLYSGALKLIAQDQMQSAIDLTLLMVDALQEFKITPDTAMMDKVSLLYNKLHSPSLDRCDLTIKALRWSSLKCDGKCGTNVEESANSNGVGHSYMHSKLAYIFWQEQNYLESRQQYLYSADGENCAFMLIECHQRLGYASEVDLFIAQVVFQFLCLRDYITASRAFHCYTRHHPQLSSQLQAPVRRSSSSTLSITNNFSLPLLNFLCLLLLAIERKMPLTAFNLLTDTYKRVLARDPSYFQYLQKIGQLFFGLSTPQHSNPLESLLSGLFQGSETLPGSPESSSLAYNSPSSLALD